MLRKIKIYLYYILARLKGANLDCTTLVELGVQVNSGLKIGSYGYIGPKSNFRGDIEIGDFFLCADNVHIVGGDHKFDDIGAPISLSGRMPGYFDKTIIGTDVWVGRNVTIMRGVSIGECCIVAAGSVVTKDLTPGWIYGGVPAKKIKPRFTEPELQEHLRLIKVEK